jgi:hypothetical protein
MGKIGGMMYLSVDFNRYKKPRWLVEHRPEQVRNFGESLSRELSMESQTWLCMIEN